MSYGVMPLYLYLEAGGIHVLWTHSTNFLSDLQFQCYAPCIFENDEILHLLAHPAQRTTVITWCLFTYGSSSSVILPVEGLSWS